MSIDVSYYSFSPSRADKQWSHFVEDISVLREKNKDWQSKEISNDMLSEKKYERSEVDILHVQFESRINEMRKKIFRFFDEKGFIIPWVEWNSKTDFTNTDERKMEYLLNYGCVFSRETKKKDRKNQYEILEKNKNIPYLTLSKDAPKLKEAYEQIINEYDQALKQLSDKLQKERPVPVVDNLKPIVELNERQKEIDDEAIACYLTNNNIFNKEGLLDDLKILDLHYGAVVDQGFEMPKIEYTCLTALVLVYDLKTEDDIPSREEWIRLFDNINDDLLKKAGSYLAKEYDWDDEGGFLEIKNYLRSIRPVIEDLKENLDAIFLRSYDQGRFAEPLSAESFLLERAKKHMEEYKGKLPPVL